MALSTVSLGRLLVDIGVVSKTAIDEVLAIQKTDDRRLGELLVDRGLVQPQQLAQILSHQMSCPWISLQRVDIRQQVLGLLPRETAIAHEVVPVHVRMSGRTKVLYVATADPTDEIGLGECARAAGMPVKPMVAVTSEIRDSLVRFYGAEGMPASVRSEAEVPLDDADVIAVVDRIPAELQAPCVLVLNAPERFLEQCRGAVASADAKVVAGAIVDAGELVALHRPCAIVVTEDVYAFDRSGLNRLAIENDTVLVVWSDDVEIRQLAPLLAGAFSRWRKNAYEKGAVIDGRYELLRDLGGPVATSRWEVRHTRTGRRSLLFVAVGSSTGEDVVGVKQQQLALARVMHPGALDLRDAGTTERGDPFVVLEPLEGRTLEGLIAARGRLHPRDASAIVLQIADVLAAAHETHVLHGDVRPENVVFVRDGYGVERVKLSGWQSAQTEDTEIDPAADVRALGALAFETILGRAPKPGEKITADLPGPLLHALERAIADDAKARFSTIGELAAAFETGMADTRSPTSFLDSARRERGLATGRPAAPGPEQRRVPRAPYRTPVRVEVPGVGAIDGRSEDVSIFGLFVVARANVALEAPVTIRFALPVDGKVVAEHGVVKWTRKHAAEGAELWAIGVELATPGNETRAQIERYVALMSDGES